MNLPEDPVMLLSMVNALLRDKYSDLHLLCDDYNIKESDIIKKLSEIDYYYNEKQNQFK